MNREWQAWILQQDISKEEEKEESKGNKYPNQVPHWTIKKKLVYQG